MLPQHLPILDDELVPSSPREGFDVGGRNGGLGIMRTMVGFGMFAMTGYVLGHGSVTANLVPLRSVALDARNAAGRGIKEGNAPDRTLQADPFVRPFLGDCFIMSSSFRVLVFAALTAYAFAAPVAYAEGLAGTYDICRTPADEQGWDAEKRDLRIRFTDQDGKYAVAFHFKANGAWKTYTDGPYEAAPPSRFRELSGAPYLSPESGAVPDGVRPSKDVPLETVVVPDTAVFMLMAADWFRRNRESNVPYDTNVIGVFVPKEGRAARRVLLCRV